MLPAELQRRSEPPCEKAGLAVFVSYLRWLRLSLQIPSKRYPCTRPTTYRCDAPMPPVRGRPITETLHSHRSMRIAATLSPMDEQLYLSIVHGPQYQCDGSYTVDETGPACGGLCVNGHTLGARSTDAAFPPSLSRAMSVARGTSANQGNMPAGVSDTLWHSVQTSAGRMSSTMESWDFGQRGWWTTCTNSRVSTWYYGGKSQKEGTMGD